MKRLFPLITVFALLTISCLAQAKKSQPDNEPPTPIQLGVMSKKQKLRSRRFNRSADSPSVIAENRDILRRFGESIIGEDSIHPLSIPSYFKQPVCQAQTIVVGKVISKNSQLSGDTTSVFTDYEIKVSSIIKNNSGSKIKLNDSITVSRPGGVVKLNDHRIEVTAKSHD